MVLLGKRRPNLELDERAIDSTRHFRREETMAHKVGIVGGDGIGPEVIAQGLRVIDAAGVQLDTTDYDLGGQRYLRDEVVLTDEILNEWRDLDAIYLLSLIHI